MELNCPPLSKISRSIHLMSRSKLKFHKFMSKRIDAILFGANFYRPSFKIVVCIGVTKVPLAKVSRSITSRSRSELKFRKFIPKRFNDILLCANFYHRSFKIVACINETKLSPTYKNFNANTFKVKVIFDYIHIYLYTYFT